MSALAGRLEKLVHDAISEHNAQYAAGGESSYPNWADDVLELCLQHRVMENTLNLMRKLIEASSGLVLLKEQAA